MIIAPIQGVVTRARHELRETVDPSAISDTGTVFTKDDAGDTELFYEDDKGRVTQFSKDGLINASAILLAITDLTDVAAKTGSGTTVVMNATPTLLTPTIASLQNAQHDHADAAGGGDLALSALQEKIALSDLTDVASTTGSGTAAVLNDTPTLLTPTIASLQNAQHDHANAAGGGALAASALQEVIALADLTDVTATTGSGTTAVLNNTPTLLTPTIASFLNAGHDHQAAAGGGQIDHGLALTGLADDDHTQYALLAGRSGGQLLIGGTGAGDGLRLRATSNATDGAIVFQSDPTTETVRILATGEWLVGANALAATEFVRIKKDQNANTQVRIQNATAGTAAQASIFIDADAASATIICTSSSFTPAGGTLADEALFRAINASSMAIFSSNDIPIRFVTLATERFRVLGDANTIQGNAGLKIEGGAGVHTLTLSGGASAASLISIGIASELIGFFGTSPVVRPTGVAVTDAAIHAALVTLGLITA